MTQKAQTSRNIYVLIVAAGKSTRLGNETPKPYLKLGNHSLIEHCVKKFAQFTPLENISVVINPDHETLFQGAFNQYDTPQSVHGGKTRKNSVFNGLKGFLKVINREDIVLIHDAARPFVESHDIEQIISTLDKAPAATLCAQAYDTTMIDDKTLDRDAIKIVLTPQGFHFSTLYAAHEKFENDENFTDDAGLVQANGVDIEYIDSSRHNFKITTLEDWLMAQRIAKSLYTPRTAMGFDVHAFESTEEHAKSGRKLMLGGIEVEHSVALKGHSDADVVLHAITDAILGGCNLGDIGKHYPPSDPQWKDQSSDFFLSETIKMLQQKGGALDFVDVTIMAEEPKIGPIREKMQQRIAEICSIPSNNVSIKATTTESLGFTGRKEGMACQALVNLSLPSKDKL